MDPSDDIFKDFFSGNATSVNFNDPATSQDETKQNVFSTDFIPGDSTSENFDVSATRQMGEEEQILEIRDITDAATLGLGLQVPSLNGSQDFPTSCQEDCSNKHNHITKFGFAEKDIVWFKRGKHYWPALVWVVLKEEVLFYIITAYNQCKAKKIQISSVEKYVHSFDDEKWTKNNLSKWADESERRNFFKALQLATSYIGKKAFSKSVDAKQFFGIIDQREFSEVDDSSESETEKKEEWDCGVPEHYSATLVSKFLSCIFNGECDQHVVSIYAGKIPSERHELYLRPNVAAQQRLHDMSWFGPFRTDLTMQPKIYNYLYSLHAMFISGKPVESYIKTVWIPESIVKAISLVNQISMIESDIFFLEIESKIPINDFLDESSDEEIPGYEFDFDDCFMDT